MKTTQLRFHVKYLFIGIIIGLIAGLSFTSCKPQYIPIESVKTEWRDKYIRDSIFEKEYINTYQKGDTVFKDRFVYIYKDRFVKDTVNVTDTIRIPYPVKGDPVEINKLKWYQEACIWFTSLVLVALALYLCIRYRKSIFSLFRKLIFKA